MEHPEQQILRRHAANDLPASRKKVVTRHVEDCPECRTAVAEFRQVQRRMRDFERMAISSYARQHA